jgi:hypothetical protein
LTQREQGCGSPALAVASSVHGLRSGNYDKRR